MKMRITILFFFFACTGCLLGQAQVRIEGDPASLDTVASVKVQYTGNTSIVGLSVRSHPGEDLGIGGYFYGGETGLLSESFNNEAIIGVSTNSIGVYGQTAGTDLAALFGFASMNSGATRGVHGKVISGSGAGVFGENTGSTGFGYGVHGYNLSSQGVGVYGFAAATSGLTTGIFGRADSDSGRGVYGNATAITGPAWGVYGRSASSEGRGVVGSAVAATGINYGVFGTSSSSAGIGVIGQALSTSGSPVGVKGESSSPFGIAVFGVNSALTGSARGLQGTSASEDGIGVYGIATHTTGETYGIYGTALSPAGYAGYFAGTAYISNIGQYDRGLRVQMNPTAGSTLEGAFVNVTGSSSNNYGGRFILANSDGAGYGISSVVNKFAGSGVSRAMFAENVSSAGGSRFGVQSEVSGNAPSAMYGVHSVVSGNAGSSPAYGVYTYVSNNATTGSSYGLYAANFNGGHSAWLNGKAMITGGEEANYTNDGYLRLGNTSGMNIVLDNNEILARDNGTTSDLHLQQNGGNVLMCELELGAVGIGVQNAANIPAGYLLAVDGKGIMEELRVELSGAWPDYVFDTSYELRDLDQLKSFIQTNGHLPNIPSAKQIEQDGLHLGEMQRRMMEKIEELTLYVIDLKEEIEQLKKSSRPKTD
ncbi:MAG: hypothetical protein R3301_15590 [Saprospiraceae bacterium]|nr:hypothetical protein [Saprospiraceae bacterium]